MSQIKDKEQAKERGEWNAMTPEQRQEADMGLKQLSMIARYHNVMGNHTIHMIELMTREIKTIFCHNSMVDRISGGLCPDSHLKYLEFQTSSHGQGFPDCPSTLSLVVKI
jgi:predicted Fe-S protein YdhL (DUF1289 family)